MEEREQIIINVHSKEELIQIGMQLQKLLTNDETIISNQSLILNNQSKIMAQLTDIQAANATLITNVAALDTVEESVVTLLNTVVGQNKDLATQLVAAIASNDPVAMQAVVDSMNASNADLAAKTQALADAVAQNTPAQP